MKVMRFMSIAEFDKFRAGELLDNRTDHHSKFSQKSDSVGFCFLDYEEYDEQQAYHFLSGIVSDNIVAVFETYDYDKFKKGSGTFADPSASITDLYSTIQVNEYSTERYHYKALKLLKYCDNFADNFKENSFDRVFEWKAPDSPIKRIIKVIDNNPKVYPKLPDSPEQRLADAVGKYVQDRYNAPLEVTQGFMISEVPSLRVENGFLGETIAMDIELRRHRNTGGLW